MEKITRRAALGLGASACGLAACSGQASDDPAGVETYEGGVSFDHGVASGDPLSDRVMIWTRITPRNPDAGTVPVYWYLEDPLRMDGLHGGNGKVLATKSNDWCVKIDVTGLDPDILWNYGFLVETPEGPVRSKTGVTRTTPASGDRPVRFGVVSCSNFQFGKFNAYEALSNIEDLDAIVHLGDYLYEYGIDGYGGKVAQQIGREHDPAHEIITLADYRTRHAQYKADKQAQMAHAAAPWICTWDDHESANNAYRTGAQNHTPGAEEGNWSDRKQAALQAYMEWMPVREPEPGNARSAFWRRFDFGDVASIMCLETRLTGRSEEISWSREIRDVPAEDISEKAAEVMTRVEDPARTMLGAEQETWLAGELNDSAASGRAWQVLANQTIMAKVRPPNLRKTLTGEQIAAQEERLVKTLIDFSPLGMPLNLDAWDGFPAARERLYQAAADADAQLVVLTGDTHTAWVNRLHDANNSPRGIEFGCTSVTSPGLGRVIKNVPDLGGQFAAANEEVEIFRTTGNGFTIVSLSTSAARAEYYEVSSIMDEPFETEMVESFEIPVSAP